MIKIEDKMKLIRMIMAMGAFAIITIFGKRAFAAETSTLRVISTSDIHNQIGEENYDKASSSNTNSLARVSTMVKLARAEVKTGGTLTVDLGDNIYGYGAEQIMGSISNPNSTVQPIYTALKTIGYDAMTLGNHDFDYGYSFLKKQLENSGLKSLMVVANIKDPNTDKYPWNRTRMITKSITTSTGRKISVKIGVVGVTQAKLSTYYSEHDYDGVLDGESILKSVRETSAQLKKQGANIVVVISHCGMGDNNVKDSSADVGYALSKISTVDCVMLGHQHRNYPSDDYNVSSFYKLPNTNRTTGLMNGKPVVMIGDHGYGIGIAELNLQINGNKISISGKKSEIRKTNSLYPEDEKIISIGEKYNAQIQKTYETKVATVASGASINSYFPTLEDSYALQVNSETKIKYGMQYIHSSAGSKYSNYHVIAPSRFYVDGSEGKDDYINIEGKVTLKDIFNIQEYGHKNYYVYWITGAQLKNRLEWSASIFSQSNEKISSDDVMKSLTEEKNVSSLVSDKWLEGTGVYEVFDGVEYQIDATKPARYNPSGKVINPGSSRIENLTYNGNKVTDSTKFVMVDFYISDRTIVKGEVEDQKLLSRGERATTGLVNYIKQLAQVVSLQGYSDYNWSVDFGDDTVRIVKSSSLSEDYAKKQPWYIETLESTDDYSYYLVDTTKMEDANNHGPLLVLAPSYEKVTNRNVNIFVQASSKNGVASIKYLQGKEDLESEAWKNAKAISKYVTITKNGTYSFCATDKKGNRTLKYIQITNINTKVLEEPEVDTFSNKLKAVTGKALPNVSVHVTVGGKTYNTTSASNGKFSCTVNRHKAGGTVSVYVSDKSGRKSAVVKTKVLHRGPNAPTVNTTTNKSTKISGYTNDNNVVLVLYMDKTAYMPKSAVGRYKASSKYNKKYSIKTPKSYSVSGGKFSIGITVQSAGKSYTVFSIDNKNRVSLVVAKTVSKAAPNKPIVNKVCDVQKYVTGKVPSSSSSCTITVKAGSKKYSGKSKKGGKYVVKTRGFKAGTIIEVSAYDKKGGKTRKSATSKKIVASQKIYKKTKDTKIITNAVTNQTTVLKGKLKKSGALFINYGELSSEIVVNRNGSFHYSFVEPLMGGKKIYLVRHSKTSGNVVEVKKITVKNKAPKVLTVGKKSLTKKSKEIVVYSLEKDALHLKIDNKKMVVKKCKYSQKKKMYVYRIPMPKKFKKITLQLKNKAGKSGLTYIKYDKKDKKQPYEVVKQKKVTKKTTKKTSAKTKKKK